jgi:hypothetical protein
MNSLNLLSSEFLNLNLLNTVGNYRNQAGPHHHHHAQNFAIYPVRATTAPKNHADLEKYNQKDFVFNGEREGVRESKFFVIKSYSKEDIVHSVKHGIWCSTETGNRKVSVFIAFYYILIIM